MDSAKLNNFPVSQTNITTISSAKRLRYLMTWILFISITFSTLFFTSGPHNFNVMRYFHIFSLMRLGCSAS